MGDECVGPNNIPEELVWEILCYLPVKSLIRFTIVSKSWFRLIRNDHQFAMKNYLTRTTSPSMVLDNVDYMFSRSLITVTTHVFKCLGLGVQEVALLPPCPTTTTCNGKEALGFDDLIPFKTITKLSQLTSQVRITFFARRNLYFSSSPRCTYGLQGEGASNANGRIYNWLFNKELELGKTELTLLSFDMGDEVLKEFPMPKCEDSGIHNHQLLSSAR